MTRNLQNGSQKPPKSRLKPSKIEPKLSQDGSRTSKKPKSNIDPTKKGLACHSVPPSWKKMWPTWLQVGFQNRSQINKKSIQKSIKKLICLGIDFWKGFKRCWRGKWKEFAIKIDPKSVPIAANDFLINRALPAAGARKIKFKASKLGAKSDQKSF